MSTVAALWQGGVVVSVPGQGAAWGVWEGVLCMARLEVPSWLGRRVLWLLWSCWGWGAGGHFSLGCAGRLQGALGADSSLVPCRAGMPCFKVGLNTVTNTGNEDMYIKGHRGRGIVHFSPDLAAWIPFRPPGPHAAPDVFHWASAVSKARNILDCTLR